MPARLVKDGLDVAPLELGQRDGGRRRAIDGTRDGQMQRQVGRVDLRSLRKQDGALHDVAELTDVARPRVANQQLDGVGRERGRVGLAELLEELPREEWN